MWDKKQPAVGNAVTTAASRFRFADYSYRADPAVPAFPDDRAVIVFDGVCVMCSGFAQFVARRDTDALAALRKSVEKAAAELERALAEQLDLPEIPTEAQVSLRKLKFLSKVAADIGAAIAEMDD